MVKFFLYARKSTDTEDKQVLSIQSQLNEVREYAQREGVEIVREFQEARSAKVPGRPVFDEIIKRVERGEAQGIIAWHPDRLARNSIDGGKVIYLVDTGHIVDLRFPTYRFDNSAQGKFMLNIIFGQSKYYVDNLSENTKRGIREKLRRGEFPGFAPIGYLNDGRGKILVDQVAAPLVRRLYERCAEGRFTLLELKKLSTASGLVSKRSKKPLSISNVHRILTNAFYCGLFFYDGELFQGVHSPILNKELFDQVQEVLKFRSKPVLSKNRYFPFRGLIRCAECGCTITAERQKGHNYYHCTRKRSGCSQKVYIREEKLAGLISEAIDKASLNDTAYTAMMDELKREEELMKADRIHNEVTREARLQEIDEQLSRLLDLYVQGEISGQEYKNKKASLITEKTDHSSRSVTPTDGKWLEPMKKFLSLAHQASYIAAAGNPEEKAKFLKIVGSNFKFANGSLFTTYTYRFRIFAKSAKNDMGWLRGLEPPTF